MTMPSALRRMLFVHAHPDDETLATGALISEFVRDGIEVGLVTASRGERGEVVAGSLPSGADPAELSAVRERELADALRALGVSWHAYLGSRPARSGQDERRYADSGMRWIRPGLAGPAEDVGPDALTSAPLQDVADDLAAAIAAYRPDAVVTYDAAGGYGHPDHVRCFEAATLACAAERTPLYVIVSDLGTLDGGDVLIDGTRSLAVVKRALGAHRTQVTVDGDQVVHSGGQREPIVTRTALRRQPAL